MQELQSRKRSPYIGIAAQLAPPPLYPMIEMRGRCFDTNTFSLTTHLVGRRDPTLNGGAIEGRDMAGDFHALLARQLVGRDVELCKTRVVPLGSVAPFLPV